MLPTRRTVPQHVRPRIEDLHVFLTEETQTSSFVHDFNVADKDILVANVVAVIALALESFTLHVWSTEEGFAFLLPLLHSTVDDAHPLGPEVPEH